jgi:hypothetical protein
MATYKVLQFNESTGQLTIEFAVGMAPLSVDVPIENGAYITGAALDTYIKGFIPTWHFERVTQINAGVSNSAELKALVSEPQEVDLPTVLTPEQQQQQENLVMWEQVEFERKIAAALMKFGVLDADPTSIPVSEQ